MHFLPERWDASRGGLLFASGLVVMAAGVSATLLLPGLIRGPTLDGAVFTEVADRVLHGGATYVDAWDHKPPAIYWTLAAVRALAAGIDPWLVTWLVSVVTASGLALVAGLLSKGRRQRAATVLVTVIYAAAYPIALGGGQTETPAALLTTAALVLALRPGSSARRACLVGFLTCGALLFSFEVLPIAFVLVVLVVSNTSGWIDRARVAGAGIGGALCVAAPAVLLVVASGAAGAAWSALVTYNFAYNALNRSQPFNWGPPSLLYLMLLPLLAMAALGTRTTLRAARRVGRALVASVVLGAVFIAWQARVEPHYVIPLLPLLAGLASRSVAGSGRVKLGVTKLATGAGVAALAVLAVCVAIPWSTQLQAEFTDPTAQSVLASWLRENANPGDAVFVWGNQPAVYYESQVAPASNYIYVFPLLTPGYVTAGDIGQVVAAIRAPQARFVIDAGSSSPGLPGLVPLLVPRPVALGDGRVADVIGPLRDAVAADYQEAAIVGGWIIYERRR